MDHKEEDTKTDPVEALFNLLLSKAAKSDSQNQGSSESADKCTTPERLLDSKYLILSLLRAKIIARLDIPCLLQSIFEVSLLKQQALGLVQSKSVLTGEGSSSYGHCDTSQQSKDDRVMIQTSQSQSS